VSVVPDVAAPHDLDPAGDEVGHEGRRLRVVTDDHVARAHHGVEGHGVLAGDALVHGGLFGTERRAVPARAVQRVVHALGDAKELRRPLEDEPADVDVEPPGVAQERAKHLGDAASRRGRVHVPDGALPEEPAQRLGLALERADAFVAEDLGERLDGAGGDVNFVHGVSREGRSIEQVYRGRSTDPCDYRAAAWTTPGGRYEPSMTGCFGQYIRSSNVNGASFGAGSQLASRALPGESA
jgi:hypothetical protein